MIRHVRQSPGALRGYFQATVPADETGLIASGRADDAIPQTKLHLNMFTLGRCDAVYFDQCFMYGGQIFFNCTYGADLGGVGYDLGGIFLNDCITDACQWFVVNNLQCFDFGIMGVNCHVFATDNAGTGAGTYGIVKLSDNPISPQSGMVVSFSNSRLNTDGTNEDPMLCVIDGNMITPIVYFNGVIAHTNLSAAISVMNDNTQKVYIDGHRRWHDRINSVYAQLHNVVKWTGQARAIYYEANGVWLQFTGQMPDIPEKLMSASIIPIAINGSTTTTNRIMANPIFQHDAGSNEWYVWVRQCDGSVWQSTDTMDFLYEMTVDLKYRHP